MKTRAYWFCSAMAVFMGCGSDEGGPSKPDGDRDAALQPPDAGGGDAMAGEPGIGAVGDRCPKDGERACSEHDSELPVRCQDGIWQGQPLCDDDARCDSRPGDKQGTCQPIAEGCQMRRGGDAFCTEDGGALITCDADRVSTLEEACGEHGLCTTDDVSACVCELGFERKTGGCQDIDECATDNGDCDPLTPCTNVVGALASCGACPTDYVGDGSLGCAPALTALALSAGVLEPALALETLDYSTRLALSTQTLSLTPSVPSGATVTINTDAVASGEAWQSPVLEVGPNALSIVTRHEGSGSRNYTLRAHRGYQEGYLKASNTEMEDRFGRRVALSGDTLVVGATYEDSNGSGGESNNAAEQSGAVYVFVRSGGTWSQQAYLKASNAEAGDLFGYSVALSGDTLVVGAYNEDGNGVGGNQQNNGALDSGAAYVFVRSGTAWNQQAYLKASNAQAGDFFGSSVAIAGDRVVVGAPGEASNATTVGGDQGNNSQSGSGAAYVFVRSGVVWTQEEYLKPHNTQTDDAFGGSVAIAGDTVVVGAAYEDSSAEGVDGNAANNDYAQSGAVHVFVRSAGNWSRQAYLKASNTGPSDFFGASLAITGDTLVVGADSEDSNATGINGVEDNDSAGQSGAAYVFVRSGTVWTQQAYLKASNTGVNDFFASAVALSGDTLLIGAQGEAGSATGVGGDQSDRGANISGAAYVFVRSGSAWSQLAYLKASNTEASDRFGAAVAIAGELLAIGAYAESSSATGVGGAEDNNASLGSGAVYLFR